MERNARICEEKETELVDIFEKAKKPLKDPLFPLWLEGCDWAFWSILWVNFLVNMLYERAIVLIFMLFFVLFFLFYLSFEDTSSSGLL